jgi:hypothetical protein
MNVMQTRSYSINVEGGLDEAWSSWFGNMRIIQLPGTPTTTTLIGSVRDQAELHGHLCKLRDLSLTLISVQRLEDCVE